MTRPLASDPLRNFKFQVSVNHPMIPSYPRMGFMSVTGIGLQTEVIPYREGGNNTTTRKMPGQSDFGPLALGRGMMAAPVVGNAAAAEGVGTDEGWNWVLEIFSVMEGQGRGPYGQDFRCGVDIDVMQHPITEGPGSPLDATPAIKARIQVFNAWPMGWNLSDLDAGGNAIIIESVTLAHEGFRVLWGSNKIGSPFLSPSAGH